MSNYKIVLWFSKEKQNACLWGNKYFTSTPFDNDERIFLSGFITIFRLQVNEHSGIQVLFLIFQNFTNQKSFPPTLPWICADTVKIFSPRFFGPRFFETLHTRISNLPCSFFKKIFHSPSRSLKNQTVTKPVLAKCNTPFSRAAWAFWAKRESFIHPSRYYPRSRTVALRGFWAKHKIRAVCTLTDGW